MTDQPLLEQAVLAIQSGDKEQGRRLLADVLAANPKDVQAWVWLARCLPDIERKRYCLEKALALQPNNQEALQDLAELASPSVPGPAQPDEQAETAPEAQEVSTAPVASLAETPSSENQVLAAEESPPKPPEKTAQKPAPKNQNAARQPKRRGMSTLQIVMLLALAAIAVSVITGGLLFAQQQTGQPAGTQPVVAGGAASTPEVFILPPTWTATPTTNPSPTIARPTATLPATLTPVPSVTPQRAEWSLAIGRSVQNRPIEIIRFGTGPSKRIIIAGIHGQAEGNTTALADQLIEHLRSHPETVPDGVSLYILRAFNVDGAAVKTQEEGRLNANGVDLNRNFEANWKAAWRGNSCASPAGSAGKAPASEPETQSLMKFLLGRQVEVLASYHSAGLGIFPSGSPPDPGSVELAQAIADVSGYAYPPVKTDCEFTGTLVDWAAQNGVRAAVDIELNDPNDTEFEKNLKVLDVLLNWQIPASLRPTSTATVSATQPITPTGTLRP